jgi:hypothetical protein
MTTRHDADQGNPGVKVKPNAHLFIIDVDLFHDKQQEMHTGMFIIDVQILYDNSRTFVEMFTNEVRIFHFHDNIITYNIIILILYIFIIDRTLLPSSPSFLPSSLCADKNANDK